MNPRAWGDVGVHARPPRATVDDVERWLRLHDRVAASSALTLKIMAIIAAMGVPVVLAYTASIYWIFRSKVTLDSDSY